MKSKKLILSQIFIFCFIVIYSCRKDFTDNIETTANTNIAFDPSTAKSFYDDMVVGENLAVNKSTAKTNTRRFSIKQSLSFFSPIWRKAISGTYQDTVVYVEVPIVTSKKVITLYQFPKDHIKLKPDVSVVQAAFQRLVIYKTRNGIIGKRILTYIPDKDYLVRSALKLSSNSLTKLQPDFFGYIEYKDWYNNILAISRIENGKVTRRYTLSTSTANSSIKSAGPSSQSIICEEACEDVYEMECRHDDNYPADVYAVICDWMKVGQQCSYTCYEDNPQPPPPLPEPNPCEYCGVPPGSPAVVSVTMDVNRANLCGYYLSAHIGNGYTGQVNGLGFTMTVTRTGESPITLPILIGSSCFQITDYLNNVATASSKFVNAYNSSVSTIMYMVSNNMVEPTNVAVRAQFLSLLSANVAVIPGSYSSGSCGGDIPSTNANFNCN